MAFSPTRRRMARICIAGTAAILAVAAGIAHGQTATASQDGTHPDAGAESAELMSSFNSYDGPRLSPNATVTPGAYGAA